MDMTGEQRIAARREIVWLALNDPDILRACIPGCQELVKTSDTEMTAVAVIKVGPISARFQGAVTLSELDPPNGYRITGEGSGGMAGNAGGGAVVQLVEAGDDTILKYEVSAQVGGKLAQIGGRMIDSTAKSLSAAFFKSFAAEIAARYGAGEENLGAVAASSTPAPIRANAPASAAPQSSPAGLPRLLLLGALLLGFSYLVLGSDAAPISAEFDRGVQMLMALAIGYLIGRKG
jgi:carbon monoxide dehydrogenase subunit G